MSGAFRDNGVLEWVFRGSKFAYGGTNEACKTRG